MKGWIVMQKTKTRGCLNSLTLKLLAMALMLCDHLWATVLPGWMWLTDIGHPFASSMYY